MWWIWENKHDCVRCIVSFISALWLTKPSWLHARCSGHSITKQTVPRHDQTHHPGYTRTCSIQAQTNKCKMWFFRFSKRGSTEWADGKYKEGQRPRETCDYFITWICSNSCYHLLTLLLYYVLPPPVFSPMRILTGTSGMCLILKVPTALRMSRDMFAISTAWRLPFGTGSPDATM